MYIRKTRDVYEVQIYYCSEYGFETVSAADTRKEAKVTACEYRENCPEYPVRIVKKRERI